MTGRWVLHEGEALNVLTMLPSASVDAVIVDPPYSSGGFTRGDRSRATAAKYITSKGAEAATWPDFAGDTRDQRAFGYWSALWLAQCLRVAKPGSPICVFTDWRQLPTMTDAMQAGGWLWRGVVPWDKTEAVRPQRGRFASQCEYVLWGSSGAMPARADVGCLPGIVRESVKRADRHHQVGKPTAVMRALARVCKRDGIILDPFAGSGTTGVGALLEGRRFVGIEMTAFYAERARERLAAAAKELPLDARRAEPSSSAAGAVAAR